MATKIGINGFGRVGRQVLKAIRDYYPNELEVVAINDLAPPETNAHLFKYDSNYGRFPGKVVVDGNNLKIDGSVVRVFAEREPGADPLEGCRRPDRGGIDRPVHGGGEGEGPSP